jgi:hypothetical protein
MKNTVFRQTVTSHKMSTLQGYIFVREIYKPTNCGRRFRTRIQRSALVQVVTCIKPPCVFTVICLKPFCFTRQEQVPCTASHLLLINSGRVHPVASIYDKTRQSRYLTNNYLFTCKYYTRLYFHNMFQLRCAIIR